MVIEVRRVVTLGNSDWKGDKGASRVLVMFYFLIWVLANDAIWVCSLVKMY